MGRKKRKIATEEDAAAAADNATGGNDASEPPPPPPPPPPPLPPPLPPGRPSDDAEKKESEEDKKKKASGYAMTSHGGEIISEEPYVSDGSSSDDDHLRDGTDHQNDDPENPSSSSVQIVLVGSRSGLMRRGLHHRSMLVQPTRQWVRSEQKPKAQAGEPGDSDGGTGAGDAGNDPEAAAAKGAEEQRKREEEELAKLDPAQRAARLLQEKQRKLEEAKELARRVESEENAGRDPSLFSKRTAFDIKFDQIDDKPWERGIGASASNPNDLSDFFNYGLSEEDWLEYASAQLQIRQELTDAHRQKRPIDTSIVPVTPREPKTQNPRVAVASGEDGETKMKTEEGDGGEEKSDDATEQLDADTEPQQGEEGHPVIGPTLIKKEDLPGSSSQADASTKSGKSLSSPAGNKMKEDPDERNARLKAEYARIDAGEGGAWGEIEPGSAVARLIEEQQQQQQQQKSGDAHSEPPSAFGQQDDSATLASTSDAATASGEYRYEPRYDKRGRDNTGGGGDYNRYGSRGTGGPPPPPPPPGGGGYRGGNGGRGGGRGFQPPGRGGRWAGPPPPPPPQQWGPGGGAGAPPPPREDNRGGWKRPREGDPRRQRR